MSSVASGLFVVAVEVAFARLGRVPVLRALPNLGLPVTAKLPGYYATETLRDLTTTLDDWRNLRQVRAGRPRCYDPNEPDPLVSIRIATYNRGQIVADRALAAAIAQTYENIEIIVVGDNCNAETVDAVMSVDDPRVRFVNLPARGLYPEIPNFRRKVAGAHPMNIATALAAGSWIAPCDDDDEFTPDHVEVLLEGARAGGHEMVWSRAEQELEPGQFEPIGNGRLQRGEVSHGTVMYRSELRFMQYSMTCWKRKEPSDWNMWKRMRRIGVRMGFVDRVTFRYYLSNARRTRLAAAGQHDAAGLD